MGHVPFEELVSQELNAALVVAESGFGKRSRPGAAARRRAAGESMPAKIMRWG